MATWLFFWLLIAALIVSFVEKLQSGRMGADVTDDEILNWLRWRVLFLHPLASDVAMLVGRCSFCENRTRIVMRLRNNDGNLYDMQVLLYVLVHELAHVAAKEEADPHGPNFETEFTRMHTLAVGAGLFPADLDIPEDYVEGCDASH